MIFGSFAAYIYLQTGQLMAAFLMHSFCNLMGVPSFGDVSTHDYRNGTFDKNYILLFFYYYVCCE
jgi:membrane protease YdiL (CAAX protease family)